MSSAGTDLFVSGEGSRLRPFPLPLRCFLGSSSCANPSMPLVCCPVSSRYCMLSRCSSADWKSLLHFLSAYPTSNSLISGNMARSCRDLSAMLSLLNEVTRGAIHVASVGSDVDAELVELVSGLPETRWLMLVTDVAVCVPWLSPSWKP